MKKEKKININELIASKDAASSEDGNILFKEIIKALNENTIVVLNFEKIELITSTFLNAAIGQLYSKYDSVELRESLKLENIANGDLAILKRVIERAKQYFKDKKNMEDAVDETLND